MYDDILLPTDGSLGASMAMEQAAELAKMANARVHVLFVADSENASSHYVASTTGAGRTGMVTQESVEVQTGLTEIHSGAMEALEERGKQVVADVTNRLQARGIGAEATVLDGVPHETIIHVAATVDADVIVMATQGNNRIERRLVGSVTERVVRSADTPVLTVSPPDF